MLYFMAEGNAANYDVYKKMDVIEFFRVYKNHMKIVKQKTTKPTKRGH